MFFCVQLRFIGSSINEQRTIGDCFGKELNEGKRFVLGVFPIDKLIVEWLSLNNPLSIRILNNVFFLNFPSKPEFESFTAIFIS